MYFVAVASNTAKEMWNCFNFASPQISCYIVAVTYSVLFYCYIVVELLIILLHNLRSPDREDK